MTPVQFRLIWIPLVLLIGSVQAYFSVKSNAPGAPYTPTIIAYVIGLIPLWAIISRKSTALVFDGLLYDILFCCIYAFVMGAMTHTNLRPINWVGILVAVTGLILLKI